MPLITEILLELVTVPQGERALVSVALSTAASAPKPAPFVKAAAGGRGEERMGSKVRAQGVGSKVRSTGQARGACTMLGQQGSAARRASAEGSSPIT